MISVIKFIYLFGLFCVHLYACLNNDLNWYSSFTSHHIVNVNIELQLTVEV